jgi:hypothetical protein
MAAAIVAMRSICSISRGSKPMRRAARQELLPFELYVSENV